MKVGITDPALHDSLLKILPPAGALLGFARLFLVIGVQRFRYEGWLTGKVAAARPASPEKPILLIRFRL